MNKLNAERHRLFRLPGKPVSAGGEAGDKQATPRGHRLLRLAFRRPGDWERVASIFHGIQDDLELPAPPVSVDGRGFCLWFPLAQAVSREQANTFLTCLIARHAADLPSDRIEAEAVDALELPPARLAGDERWSAFIDPGMGSLFIDEPWLEMAPTPDKQAELLAGFSEIKAEEFERALSRLAPAAPRTPSASDTPRHESAPAADGKLSLNGPHADPQSFLLAVMNDPNASPALRVEAAKALLPYYPPAKRPG